MPTPISGAGCSAFAPAIVVKPVSGAIGLSLGAQNVKRISRFTLVVSLPFKRGVKRHPRRCEVQGLDERAGFARAVLAVHLAVFPLDRERAGVAHVVEGADDLL